MTKCDLTLLASDLGSMAVDCERYESHGQLRLILDALGECIYVLGVTESLTVVLPKVKQSFHRFPLMR